MNSVAELDPAALLAAEEAGLRERRQGDVDGLLRLLAWCDLHSGDPQSQPGAVPVKYGGDRLVVVGGEGTPKVAELCFEEFAIAGRAGAVATSNKAADALDLRHRLPLFWAKVQELAVEAWVARKVASLSRRLSVEAVAVVDAAVSAGVDLAPGKLIELAEAKVIEADPQAHRERIAADTARTGVWLPRRRPGQAVADVDGQPEVQPIAIRIGRAGAVEFATTVDEIAHALAEQHAPAHDDDVPTMDQWRAHAVELLADPHGASRFLDGLGAPPSQESTDTQPVGPTPIRPPRTAVLHIHLSAAALAGCPHAVARVEDLGPMLLRQVTELVGHRHVVIKPVIDLNATVAVDRYEHPTACKERTLLRTGGDVFPHSTSRTRRVDNDHPTPYDADGPPGQTGDHNDAPLTRRHHRAKTHRGYRVRQLGLGAYRWETPHGLTRVVSQHGTTPVDALRAADGSCIGEVYPSRVAVEWQLR